MTILHIPGYIGGKPFSDAIVANCAAIDSNEVIFCCGNVCLNKSDTDFGAAFGVDGKLLRFSLSEQSLESLSDSVLVYYMEWIRFQILIINMCLYIYRD